MQATITPRSPGNLTRRSLGPLLGAAFLAALFAPSARTGPASTPIVLTPGAIISNGTVQLGVHKEGHLNIEGSVPSAQTGTTTVGLRYMPTNYESTAPGCACEGWGVADLNTGTAGYANESQGGAFGMTLVSFTSSASTAESVVEVGGILRVTHDYHPSTVTDNLYEVKVTIENISTLPTNVLYRRLMDWDIEPTAFSEYVTIDGSTSANVLYASDNGFASANPLDALSSILFTGDAVDSGPFDHGSLFQFSFGMIDPGDCVDFKTYYGAAGNETDALAALGIVGAEVYSLGQTSTDPINGEPNTFIFAFGDVGGQALVPCEPPPWELEYTFNGGVLGLSADVAVYALCDTPKYVFVADTGDHQIVRYMFDGNNFFLPFVFPPNGLPPLEGPTGIAVNDLPDHPNHGQVYVTDHGSSPPFGLVRIYDTNGCFLASLSVDPNSFFPDFLFPNGIAIDEQGDLYVSDGGLGVAYKFSQSLFNTLNCANPISILAGPLVEYDVTGFGYPLPDDVSVDFSGRVNIVYDDGSGDAGLAIFSNNGTSVSAGPTMTSTNIPVGRGVDAKEHRLSSWVTNIETLENFDWILPGTSWNVGPVISNNFWTWRRDGIEYQKFIKFESGGAFEDKKYRCEERLFSAGPFAVSVFGREYLSSKLFPDAVSWLRFDEHTGPIAGDVFSGFNATWLGIPNHSRGVVRCAIGLTGAGDSVVLPHRPALDFGSDDFTIEGWVRAELESGFRHILDKRNGPLAGYRLFLHDGYLGLGLNNGSFANIYVPPVPENFVADGKWHHFCVTVDRTSCAPELRLYVDNVNTDDMTFSNPLPGNISSGTALYIGRNNPGAGPFDGMTGNLDELTLYDRALNDAEVRSIFCADCAGKDFPAPPPIISGPTGGIFTPIGTGTGTGIGTLYIDG